MPNWCFTNYIIEGNAEEISDLHQKLADLQEREESLLPNGFGKNWLGNVVHLFNGDWEKINCRGDFQNLEIQDTILTLSTETAWGDLPEVWDFVLSQYKTLKYYFCAEESGNEYYATNDIEGKYFSERYIAETPDGTDYFDTEDEAIKYLFEALDEPIPPKDQIEAFIEQWLEENEDDFIAIHQINVLPPPEDENHVNNRESA